MARSTCLCIEHNGDPGEGERERERGREGERGKRGRERNVILISIASYKNSPAPVHTVHVHYKVPLTYISCMYTYISV